MYVFDANIDVLKNVLSVTLNKIYTVLFITVNKKCGVTKQCSMRPTSARTV